MTDTHATRAKLEKSTRFFARPISFDIECPHCGAVYQIRVGGTLARRNNPNWDPSTARFVCTGGTCGRSYVLGMVAWPIIPAPKAASQTPRDQVPGPRELAQMRKEGGGWWLHERDGQRYRRPDETNLTTEAERPERDDDDDDLD